MNNDIIKILGKDFQFIRIEKITSNEPIIFIEEGKIEKCKEALKKVNITTVYTLTDSVTYLSDPIFKNIKKLYINSFAQDIPDLHHLNNLNLLEINSENPFEIDFSHFKNLTSLTCNYSDKIKHLESLTKLTSLQLYNFTESDFLIFKNLTKLKKLVINFCFCKKLSGIENLTKLKDLILSSYELNSIKSIESLSRNLKTIELSSKTLTDLRPLQKLINLKSLKLSSFSKIDNLSFLKELKFLEILKIENVDECDSLIPILSLDNLKKLYISPWDVKVKNNSYLPLTKKLLELGKLTQIIEWEGIKPHLDIEGKEFYNNYFGESKLEYIKKNFRFNVYEDFSEPYTKENCDKVDVLIIDLIDQLEKNKELNEKEKLNLFKKTVSQLTKLDTKIQGFIETGERAYLSEILEEIADTVDINNTQFESIIAKL